MGIKTLQNQSQFLGKAFLTLCTLSKGEMQGNRPIDLDYFKPREFLNETIREVFHTLYGEKPTQFNNVMLLGNTAENIAPHWMEEWGKSAGLTKRCDGEVMQLWRDKDGQMQSEPMQCACALEGKVTCKPTMYLSLIFPDLIRASGYLGIVRLTLHSPRELSHILTVIQAQPAVVGLPIDHCRWTLGRKPEDVTVIINDKPAKTKKYFVKLSIDMENTLAGNPLLEVGEIRQLTAKTDVDAETGEIIEPEETSHEWSTEEMLNAFEKVLADDSLQLSDDWYTVPIDNLEEMLLDELVELKTPVMVQSAQVIKTDKGLFYALDFGFNQSKKIILKMSVQKGDKVDSKVNFQAMQATLSKTPQGNYAATPIS